jgi:hypothetical protein
MMNLTWYDMCVLGAFQPRTSVLSSDVSGYGTEVVKEHIPQLMSRVD